jgi:hypothetical protein
MLTDTNALSRWAMNHMQVKNLIADYERQYRDAIALRPSRAPYISVYDYEIAIDFIAKNTERIPTYKGKLSTAHLSVNEA